MDAFKTQCCIAGGGPAGMMLGLLLARAGVNVLLLEKHADFLRDFRGDTIHPSTLEVMHELGILDEFLRLPHQKVPMLRGQVGELAVTIADFSHLPTRCKFIAMMPQWDFLDFLVRQGRQYPGFRLMTRAKAKRLVERDARVIGLVAETDAGKVRIDADLVVGADGRHSTIRQAAGLVVEDLGAPMDVLWFRLSKRQGDPEQTMGRFDVGRIFVLINRGEHWQCGYVIAKDSIARVHAQGIEAFRADVARLVPFARDRTDEIATWDDVKLLTVGVNRLKAWHRPGVLCVGDAAHTMSPVGGVGINLAIQDAVATANLLWRPLKENRLADSDLAAVQRRREFPTRVTQRMQVIVQDRVISQVLGGTGPVAPPLGVRLLAHFPFLRRIPARLIGYGIRPEHVQSPQAG
jgi:2-polyprenyl-6-methoxyphenol hydroxylase-like FAD-dependent oxidoreductase